MMKVMYSVVLSVPSSMTAVADPTGIDGRVFILQDVTVDVVV